MYSAVIFTSSNVDSPMFAVIFLAEIEYNRRYQRIQLLRSVPLKMSTEPTQTVDQEVKDFVDANYVHISQSLSRFKRVADDLETTAATKLNQLVIFVSDVAKEASINYTKKVDNDAKLVYDIALVLIDDERAYHAVNVARAIWDQLPDQVEYQSFEEFEQMLVARDNGQKLDKKLKGGWCC